MKKALAKLRGNAGESIGETLIALLISALALMMLAGAVSSAANIVSRNRAAITAYYGGKDEDGEYGADYAQQKVFEEWTGYARDNLK